MEMKTFERRLPTEDADIQEIVRGILHAQARTANAQHRPLLRGTHTKGVCVRGTFEVYDLAQTISDPTLRGRLAQGMFAKPGTYPATIRFANADTKIAPDSVPDVRAVSFAVELPPGVVGPEGFRHDFSLNSATTFPINNAHSFAVFVRLLEADGLWGKLKAITSLSPAEMWGFLLIGIRALPQKRSSATRLYQRLRYWSNTPFRHGPDEAVKYSATARPGNPGRQPARSDNMLRDELVRHVDVDDRMSEFEFGIQLLDADQMTRRGRKHDDIYWVENASAEWHESQAPFTPVGRLCLARDSQLTEDECTACYIDVTEHSTPLSHPLGSLNRARWFAESASRATRFNQAGAGVRAVDPQALPDSRAGAPLPAVAASQGTWLGRITLHTLARAVVFLALGLLALSSVAAIITTIYVDNNWGTLPPERVDRVDYPDRGWGSGLDATDRQAFYYTPQGAGLKDLRYKWLVNLELPWGKQRLADPVVMRRYGFLVDEVTARNPDRLPVGFTKHFDPALNEELLDVTCAACHTGQLNVTSGGRTRALRIDGGSANHAFTDAHMGQFLPTLIASMAATALNPLKFNRFANRVLGPASTGGKWTLHRELRSVIATFVGIAWNERVRRLYPTQEGYGRTDALARIGNTVFAEHLVARNYHVGDAPVSYPALWNIWKFDWVQYNASVSQPMARNIGESMGVGARYVLVDPTGNPLPAGARFRSTALIDSLNAIEHTLRKLKPPAWQEDILGKVDQAKAAQGLTLFNQHCVGCHGPHVAPPGIKLRNTPFKADSEPEWLVATLCADDIATDSNAAHNFSVNTVDITPTGMTAMELRQVARRAQEQWYARESVFLKGELKQPNLTSDSVAILEAQLAGLHNAMEQNLSQIDPSRLPLGAALSYLGTMVREKAYAAGHYTTTDQAELDGFGALDLPQVVDAYKSRPLAGIWATPPFLHNGSVPTVYDLLSAPAERPKTFKVGSREYDTKHLGLADPAKVGLANADDFWTFDTSLPGNHNTGHEFGPGYKSGSHQQVRPGLIGPKLSEEEKMAIIEYLKVRDDDRDGPKQPTRFPRCGSPE